IGWNRSPAPVQELAADGLVGASSFDDVVAKLSAPRIVWVMLPSGQVTEDAITAFGEKLSAGDILIDGGNSFYKDDIRRAQALAPKNISYVDIGTSGGVWGLERGFCMMTGGDKAAIETLDPILKTLAPGLGSIPRTARATDADPRAEQGYIHAGPAGAGHF